VGSVDGLDSGLIDQLQVGLVDQRGGVEYGIATVPRELVVRDAAQVLVDQRHKPREGALVASAVRDEQIGDVLVGHSPLVLARRMLPRLPR
jgi:hypothetical protein